MKETGTFLAEALDGLTRQPKTLPCKYFYDERGSALFEDICEQPEYYPTRTELRIMEEHAPEMARALGPELVLIEYGSGSSRKTRVLLEALENPAAYLPIDISKDALFPSAESIAKEYPKLAVLPICGDYLDPIPLPKATPAESKRAVYFPGSTIGNFVPHEAVAFLRRMAEQVGAGGAVLIGVDLKKDARTLELAYDDRAGVTAAFNLNLLVRINRELGADFALDAFRHEARWNEAEGRVEMHLVANQACEVRVGSERVAFEAGESIHTENSYKYEISEFEALAARAGLRGDRRWMDRDEKFSVQLYDVV
ncbi:MAG: L-histidine N(alpha)-methyltransferase [Myxococcota bacterium]|nr:L-histidine N(alpha)-methyltransferase [Myxococcota bacterium]